MGVGEAMAELVFSTSLAKNSITTRVFDLLSLSHLVYSKRRSPGILGGGGGGETPRALGELQNGGDSQGLTCHGGRQLNSKTDDGVRWFTNTHTHPVYSSFQ